MTLRSSSRVLRRQRIDNPTTNLHPFFYFIPITDPYPLEEPTKETIRVEYSDCIPEDFLLFILLYPSTIGVCGGGGRRRRCRVASEVG